MRTITLLFILFTLSTSSSSADIVDLDQSFFFKDTTIFGNRILYIRKVSVLPDNTLLALIDVEKNNVFFSTYLVKLLANGDIDNSFLNQEVYSTFVVQPDNKIITVLPTNSTVSLVRLHADGRIDNSFQNYSFGAFQWVSADFKVLSDNSLLVGWDGALSRLSQDGTTVTRIKYFGDHRTYRPTIFFINSDNEGIYYRVKGGYQYNLPGHRTDSWTVNALGRMDQYLNHMYSVDLESQAGGGAYNVLPFYSRLYFFGGVKQQRKVLDTNNNTMYGIACTFDPPNNGFDTLFNIPKHTISGFDKNENPYSAIPFNGKIILVGSFKWYNGFPVNNIIRIERNGTLDRTFITGQGPDSSINAIYEGLYNSLFVVGNFKSYNGVPRRFIAKLKGDKQRFQYEWYNNLTIKPNPATDLCTIDNIPFGYSVRITDVIGSTIRTYPPAQQTSILSIDTRAMSSGIYFIYIQDTDGNVMSKTLSVEH